MLYDIIPLPMRYRKGAELSSLVPYIDNGALDDTHSLGWEVSIDPIMDSGFSKYKTLDIIGNTVLERVFFTEKPIDLNKTWWTSTDMVYPLYQRGYGGNTPTDTVRYLTGSMALLDTQANGPKALSTIHTHILCTLLNSVYWSGDVEAATRSLHEPCRHLVIGKDKDNLNLLTDARELEHCPEYYMSRPVVGVWIPKVNVDPLTREFLTKTVTLDALNKFKSNAFGVPMCGVLSVDITPPFDPADEDVLYTETDIEKRDAFLTLLSEIESVDATDYCIKLAFTDKKVIDSNGEFYNRYKGVASHTASVDGMTELIIGVQRWQWKTLSNNNNKLAFVQIVKYWTDEAYITLGWVDGSVTKYYVDLVLYNSISRCVMDTQL